MNAVPKEFIKTSHSEYTYQGYNLWRIHKFPFSHWKAEMVDKTYICFNAETLKEVKQKILAREAIDRGNQQSSPQNN